MYDLRYFFFENDAMHSTCGMAFETLMKIRCQLDDGYSNHHWYRAVSLSPNNTALGYLVEHMCLTAIERGALKSLDPQLGQLGRTYFDDAPPVAHLINGPGTCQLYVPSTFRFPDIDAAIVRLDRKAKRAHIYLIRVTIAKYHKESETNFYQRQWGKWKETFPDDYGVQSTFIWIHRGEPGAQSVQEATRRARTEEEVVMHEHESVHLGIKEVDPKLLKSIDKLKFQTCT
jgi:hypothetical protein